MSQPANTRLSSVARKFIMGVTGLLLIGFLLTHLAGNLQLYLGKEAFNAYSHFLHSIHGFVMVELGLAAIFLIHIWMAISLTMENRKARPIGYAKRVEQVTLSSRIMPYTGLVVLVFLVVHIITVRFGDIEGHVDGVFGVVKDVLSNPLMAVLYLAGVIFLAPHLRHGIHSSVRSLGLSNPRYLTALTHLSTLVAAVLTVGFASMPLWALMTR